MIFSYRRFKSSHLHSSQGHRFPPVIAATIHAVRTFDCLPLFHLLTSKKHTCPALHRICRVSSPLSLRIWGGKTIITPPRAPAHVSLRTPAALMPSVSLPHSSTPYGPTHLRLGALSDASGGAAPAHLYPSARGAAGLAARVSGGGPRVGVAAVAAGRHAAAAGAAREATRSSPGVVA